MSAAEDPSRRLTPAFSWQRAAMHALWGPVIIGGIVLLIVLLGAIPISDRLARATGAATTQSVIVALGVSYLIQTRRSAGAWALVIVTISLMVLGLIRGLSVVAANRDDVGRNGAAQAVLDSPGSWEYHSVEYGFSLTLPSKNWRLSAKTEHIVDFTANPAGSPMLAAVVSVEAQTRAQFEDSVSRFKANIAGAQGLQEQPEFEVAETDVGNRYVFGTFSEETREGPVYVAASRVWLKARGVTVATIFEGHSHYLGDMAQAVERSNFEQAARLICRSVK